MKPSDKARLKKRIQELIMHYTNNRERHYCNGIKKLHQMEAISAIRRKLAWYIKLSFESNVKMVIQLKPELNTIMPEYEESRKNMALAKSIQAMIIFCEGRQTQPQQLEIAS